jgi:glucose/arabinose dehydrogenase
MPTPRATRSARLATAVTAASALALVGCSPDVATPSASPSAVATEVARPAPSASATPLEIGGSATATVVEREDIVTGLDAPWDMEFMPDGAILVSGRDNGNIYRVRGGLATALNGPGLDDLNAAIDTTGEGGLLGLALHPENPELLYVYVTRLEGNAVMRFHLRGDLLSDSKDVLARIPHAANHDGGRIAFGPDGYLYVTTGDAANPQLAQDRDNPAGKILRVIADGTDADGTAAPDNPFGNVVWTYGHRNVQGLDWVADGRMYASEFGQNAFDELNLIAPGLNYGWPQVEARAGAPDGVDLGATVDDLTYPVAEWRTDEASPSGIAITHEAIYVAALRGRQVWRVPLTTDGIGEPHVLVDDLGRIRNVEIGPDGALYVLTNNTDGRGDPRENDDRIVRLVIE